jgi:hypothetical protein
MTESIRNPTRDVSDETGTTHVNGKGLNERMTLIII